LLFATLGQALIRVPTNEDGKLDWTKSDRSLLLSQRLRIRDLAIDSGASIYAAVDNGWLLRLGPADDIAQP